MVMQLFRVAAFAFIRPIDEQISTTRTDEESLRPPVSSEREPIEPVKVPDAEQPVPLDEPLEPEAVLAEVSSEGEVAMESGFYENGAGDENDDGEGDGAGLAPTVPVSKDGISITDSKATVIPESSSDVKTEVTVPEPEVSSDVKSDAKVEAPPVPASEPSDPLPPAVQELKEEVQASGDSTAEQSTDTGLEKAGVDDLKTSETVSDTVQDDSPSVSASVGGAETSKNGDTSTPTSVQPLLTPPKDVDPAKNIEVVSEPSSQGPSPDVNAKVETEVPVEKTSEAVPVSPSSQDSGDEAKAVPQ